MKTFTSRFIKHTSSWCQATIDAFMPVNPTSIRGLEYNQRGAPGTR